jgi:hypothetical protein
MPLLLWQRSCIFGFVDLAVLDVVVVFGGFGVFDVCACAGIEQAK